MVCSLLNTTENTRDLGGYITRTGNRQDVKVYFVVMFRIIRVRKILNF